jgi:hypothetical protein
MRGFFGDLYAAQGRAATKARIVPAMAHRARHRCVGFERRKTRYIATVVKASPTDDWSVRQLPPRACVYHRFWPLIHCVHAAAFIPNNIGVDQRAKRPWENTSRHTDARMQARLYVDQRQRPIAP